jgi:hypothetical protein
LTGAGLRAKIEAVRVLHGARHPAHRWIAPLRPMILMAISTSARSQSSDRFPRVSFSHIAIPLPFYSLIASLYDLLNAICALNDSRNGDKA